jgi:hypothetical protein
MVEDVHISSLENRFLMDEDLQLVAMKSVNASEPTLGVFPSLVRVGFAKRAASAMTPLVNPNVLLSSGSKALGFDDSQASHYPVGRSGRVCEHFGDAWLSANGLRRNEWPNFTHWVPS